MKISMRIAGAQGANPYTAAMQREGKVLRQRDQVSLAGAVVAAARARYAACHGSNVDYPSKTALAHGGYEQVAELRHGQHHQLEKRLVICPVAVLEQIGAGDPGVVDQVVDFHTLCAQAVVQCLGRRGIRQVRRFYPGVAAMCAGQLSGEGLQFFLASRHEHKVVALCCQLPCELLAESRGCSGNQRCALACHGFSPQDVMPCRRHGTTPRVRCLRAAHPLEQGQNLCTTQELRW